MHLFTPEFPKNTIPRIKKYESIEDIISDFYETRKIGFELRKKFIMNSMQEELLILKNKILFIKEIISGGIKINDISLKELISILLERGYYKGPNNFEYLTNIKIYNLTREKKKELEELIEKKELEFSSLAEKTPLQLWEEDLELLKKNIL